MPFGRENLFQVAQSGPRILPSLLLCDFGQLRKEIELLEAAGIRGLHLDVMDGHFVPNFTYGMTIVRAVRQCTHLLLDVHLMITQPRKYLAAFREAGADHITIHAEATEDLAGDLSEIRNLGATAGVALNPDTGLDQLTAAVGRCDLVLIMTVPAGFGAQAIRRDALEKLGPARQMFGQECLLEVDGGIDRHTAPQAVAAGAQLLVVGSAIFREPDYAQAIRAILPA